MKKPLLFVSANLLAASAVLAQLPVSTALENRKVILEEFTGKTCQFCPDGHKRADDLAANNPGNVFVINIHAGSFAGPDPDYKTPFGAALVSQSSLTGYPAGTVNRHLFPGLSQNASNPGTAMGRGNWNNAANQILSQPSYVNVAMQGTIDEATRMVTVDVQAFYTGDSPLSTNYLHVALVQDSILGPQTGGATYYPAMMVNGQYQHNKMLRHMLTGAAGDQITTTTTGSLVTKQFTYAVPMQLPVTTPGTRTDVNLKKLRAIAFITETNQTIVSGNDGPMTFIPLTSGIEEQINNLQFNVYPNPFSNTANITLTLDKQETVNVKVYNMLGAEVFNYNQKHDKGTYTIPFDGTKLSDGMYNVNVQVGEVSVNRKLTLIK